MTEGTSQLSPRPIKVVRIIARLNIGGPAIQAITLTKQLEAYGYETILVRGSEEHDEGNMDHLAEALEVRPVRVPYLRRNPGWHDLRALAALVRILRRERPDIVHTHAAKGGTLGRAAALLAFPSPTRRPVLVHTYHGHSLTGYFSDRTAGVYRRIEQMLGRFTARLVAVGTEVRDDLVRLGVAPASKFEVVALGFNLSSFQVNDEVRQAMRSAFRAELGIPQSANVVTLVARLVPIKRVDRFLKLANMLTGPVGPHFLIIGDGELRSSLATSPDATNLGDRLTWAGFRRDMPAAYFASDVVVQTSDNEGTPVSLIEAQAAAVPVVSTRVGGVASVVPTKRLAEPDDLPKLCAMVRELLLDPEERMRIGIEGASQVRTRYALSRLVTDLVDLYSRLGFRPFPTTPPTACPSASSS